MKSVKAGTRGVIFNSGPELVTLSERCRWSRFLLETGGYDVSVNPCEGIRRPRYTAPLPQILTQEEAERLLAAACGHGPDPLRNEVMFRLLGRQGGPLTSPEVDWAFDHVVTAAGKTRLRCEDSVLLV